uniref:Putative secreted protein n=1 Tax=Ixodes ricinus TaxID=34613 RepID=A0A6B0UHB9_IXORI
MLLLLWHGAALRAHAVHAAAVGRRGGGCGRGCCRCGRVPAVMCAAGVGHAQRVRRGTGSRGIGCVVLPWALAVEHRLLLQIVEVEQPVRRREERNLSWQPR